MKINKTSLYKVVTLIIFCLIGIQAQAQLLQNKKQFTRQDSLRGGITPERAWWELQRYDLSAKVEPDEKFISGSNQITYKVLASNNKMQIDLQEPMLITKVVQNDKELKFTRDGNVYYILLQDKQLVATTKTITVFFKGHPREAKNAPWDGGFSWKKDEKGNHFIATSNQGLGASVWWPCKDHMYEEAKGMTISVNVPSNLMNVSNGRLIKVKELIDNTTTYTWQVTNPINNYGVNINIGNYTHFGEVYSGEKGDLHMDYYVLEHHLEKAKNHFTDAPKMMKAFEHWFGPYPFYEDSFKLVEVPYLGMEHQSSVTYGNKFKQGYLGRDLSGTGWGLKFDFIIIHEAGHEWFANSITNKDIADMWIHESFTAYSESLFLDYYYGKQAAQEYIIGTRRTIQNDRPLIGHYNVNHEGSGDMYYKGANLLHTIRTLVDDDDKWRSILRDMNKTFYHQTVTTKQIEDFLIEKTSIALQKVFDQYLRDTRIPKLVLKSKGNKLVYYWENTVDDFSMPVDVYIGNNKQRIIPTTKKQTMKLSSKFNEVNVDDNYYIQS
ncbi:M1 family metallopeptidase [Nonlabens sp. SY33080]|uniref:M1 family metallopeptidase n=1 Tax=Nonlabens sp. SY33080 TaxID=2719911 RepID=UPI001428C3B1|nr:M1 family metallopeptidase [Nonlabens sp. SY33080]